MQFGGSARADLAHSPDRRPDGGSAKSRNRGTNGRNKLLQTQNANGLTRPPQRTKLTPNAEKTLRLMTPPQQRTKPTSNATKNPKTKETTAGGNAAGEPAAFMKNGGKRRWRNRRFFENGGKPPRLHSTLIYLFPPLKCGKLGNLCTAFWKTAHPIGISYANRFRYLPDGSVCWMLLWGNGP